MNLRLSESSRLLLVKKHRWLSTQDSWIALEISISKLEERRRIWKGHLRFIKNQVRFYLRFVERIQSIIFTHSAILEIAILKWKNMIKLNPFTSLCKKSFQRSTARIPFLISELVLHLLNFILQQILRENLQWPFSWTTLNLHRIFTEKNPCSHFLIFSLLCLTQFKLTMRIRIRLTIQRVLCQRWWKFWTKTMRRRMEINTSS